MRPLLIFAVILLLGVLAALLLSRDQPLPSIAQQDVDVAAEAATAPGREPDSPAPPIAPLPSEAWDLPLAPNLSAWRKAASREPVEAFVLADRLSQCALALVWSAENEQDLFERRRDAAKARGSTIEVLQQLDEEQAQASIRRADCNTLDVGYEAEMLGWYERAAREVQDVGLRSAARLAYARQAFIDFPSEADILARLDEAQRRRDLARAWLLAELESGNDQALRQWLSALGDGSPLFPRADPVTRHAWLFVEALRNARRQNGEAAELALWDEPQSGGWHTGDLSPEQIAAALEAGRAHHLRLFGPPGG